MTELFCAATFGKGTLCWPWKRGFTLESFLRGSGRVIEETSVLEAMFFLFNVKLLFMLFPTGRGKLFKFIYIYLPTNQDAGGE